MTLKELYEKEFPKTPFICIYWRDENGVAHDVQKDYADEFIETHGDKVVKDYGYAERFKALVVQLAKEDAI